MAALASDRGGARGRSWQAGSRRWLGRLPPRA